MGLCISKMDNSQQYDDLVYEGWLYNCADEFEKSLDVFNIAISLDPHREIAHMYRGVALRFLGKLDEGIKSYEQALKINPNYIYAIQNIAYAKAKDSGNVQSQEYLSVADKVIKFKAVTHDDYIGKSFAYEKLGNIDKQIEMMKEALKLDANPMTYFNLGVVLDAQGKHAEAEGAYRSSLDLKKEAKVCYNLAIVREKMGDGDDAIALFMEAIKLNPKDPLSYSALGSTLYYNGKETEAIKFLNKAFEVYQDPANHDGLCADNHAYLEAVFSHERAELLAKFTELSAANAKIIEFDVSAASSSEKDAVQKLNREGTRLKEQNKAALDKLPQMLDADTGSIQAIVMQLLQQNIAYQARLDAIEAPTKYVLSLKATPKLHHYYDGLVYTITAAYTSSQVTEAGNHAVDTSNIGVSIIAGVASLAPIGGNIIGKAINTGYGVIKTAAVKREAAQVSKIASTPGECEKLVLHLSMKLTIDPSKSDEINHIAERPMQDLGLFAKFMHWGEGFCNKINGEHFVSPEAKLGRNDALKVLDAIVEGRIDLEARDSLVEQFCACVMGYADDA